VRPAAVDVDDVVFTSLERRLTVNFKRLTWASAVAVGVRPPQPPDRARRGIDDGRRAPAAGLVRRRRQLGLLVGSPASPIPL
jgi:hypothetical protein